MNKVACTKESLSKQKQLFGFTMADQVKIYGSNIRIQPKDTSKSKRTNRHHLLLNLINDNQNLIYDKVLPSNVKVKNIDIVSFYKDYENFLFGNDGEKLTKSNYMVCLGNKEASISNFFSLNRQETKVTPVQLSIFIALQFEIKKCKGKKKCTKKIFSYFYDLGYAKAVAI